MLRNLPIYRAHQWIIEEQCGGGGESFVNFFLVWAAGLSEAPPDHNL